MKLKLLLLIPPFLIGLQTNSPALTVLPLSEVELTKRATLIATGVVEDVYSAHDPDRTTILTYIKVRITETLKGKIEGPYATLRQMGGVVGDEMVMVPGSPAYEPGEELLVFAGPLGKTGYFAVLGIFYGKYAIGTDPLSGRKIVSGPSFETVHYDPETLEALPVRERPDPVFLDDFLAEIRSYLHDAE